LFTLLQLLDALMKQSKASKVKGVFGRLGVLLDRRCIVPSLPCLGDLGTIDAKYDCAVTTACGALNDIVVDTTATAQVRHEAIRHLWLIVQQWCVEFLKQTNGGRATFIILEKVTKGEIPTIQTPGNVPRLFDLIAPAVWECSRVMWFIESC
jgi:structural maintenance of chromosome 4